MRINRERQKRKRILKRIMRYTKVLTCVVLIVVFVFNPFAGGISTSLGKQEFFSYHLRDLMGLSDVSAGEKDYYLSTGTYESTTSGDLFGKAKGRNLIVIQVESLQNMMIGAEYNGQEITPNLNALISRNDSLYFDKYYQQLGSGNTSDSEFVTNNSLIGSINSYTYNLYQNNYFKGLPWILKENGYSTAAVHSNDKTFWNRENVYPKMGFDEFINSDYFENDHLIGSGRIQGTSDKSMFSQSIAKLNELKKPFYSFFVTLSSHHPYKLPEELQKIELKEKDKDTLFGNYINAVHYADEAIGSFIDELKKANLYNNSVIAIYGDHFGLSSSDEDVYNSVTEFLGKDYTFIDQMNIPLIINIPGATDTGGEYDIVGGEVDFLPTISYLLGIKKMDTLYLGQNLLTAKSGFVAEQTHMLKGSFFTDDIMFDISRDGILSHSNVFDMKTGKKIKYDDSMENLSLKAKQLIELSEFYLENDVLSLAIEDGMTIEEILQGTDLETTHPEFIADPGIPSDSSDTKSQIDRITELYEAGNEYIVAYVKEENDEKKDPASSYKITPDELLKWMDKHRNVKILLMADDDSVLDILSTINSTVDEEYNEYLSSNNGILSSSQQHVTNIGDKIIPVLENMNNYTKTQYSGYEKVLFAPSANKYTEKEMEEFFKLNSPWAVAADISGLSEINEKFKTYKGFIYANMGKEKELSNSEKKKLGIDGIISESAKSK